MRNSPTTGRDATRCLLGLSGEQKSGEDFWGHRTGWEDRLGNFESVLSPMFVLCLESISKECVFNI